MPSKEVLEYYGLNSHSGKILYFVKRFYRYIFEVFASICPFKSMKVRLYRACGLNIGEDVYIGNNVLFDRAFPQMITIGNHVAIGDRTTITAHAHIPTDTPLKKIYPRTIKPVTIEDGVWIMPNVTIINGVTIGKEAVVATGAIVIKDVPPRTLVAGIPAKVVKDLNLLFDNLD